MSNTITSAISSASSGGGSDIAAQIKNITQQINKLIKQLGSIAQSSLSADQKQQQQQLIENQIQMLEAQINQLQQQQAQNVLNKQEAAATAAAQTQTTGVNGQSDTHQVDVYI
ncbi:BlyB family putative holin accessory protein [Sodalis sp. RH21]|uniref:BlyB family putative holin accessory protein n=1 Tax=unclassified Sodalis (in: enterobacteria) TaxID=2636512 RepID=UPI0039B5233E